jgi:hypothetical protein
LLHIYIEFNEIDIHKTVLIKNDDVLGKSAHPEMGMVGRVFRGTRYLASPAFAEL